MTSCLVISYHRFPDISQMVSAQKNVNIPTKSIQEIQVYVNDIGAAHCFNLGVAGMNLAQDF